MEPAVKDHFAVFNMPSLQTPFDSLFSPYVSNVPSQETGKKKLAIKNLEYINKSISKMTRVELRF